MHLPTYLFACTAVSLSTAKYIGGKKPPADCDRPVQFLKGKEFVDKINEHRSRMIKGKQNNGGHGKLPTGENVLEMEWNCMLETEAFYLLNNECPDKSPAVPNGKTGFYYRGSSDPLNVWLSEINKNKIELHSDPEAFIKYGGVNENYCNLVRYDVSRIGCAETTCGEVTSTFCLTDHPPLVANQDVVYYWGRGACHKEGKCRPPTSGCNTKNGLCFKPLTTTGSYN